MQVFVFGSNEAGRHGAGAALFALKNHGAVWGQGVGLQGSSYAIPTKDFSIRTLPLSKISEYFREFLDFASTNPEMTFHLTPIGCGLAGYSKHEIAKMMLSCGKFSRNIVLTHEWITD